MSEPLILSPDQRGRWDWVLLSEMEIGDFFLVSHGERDPGRVRNYVAVSGHRLGRSFSVKANDGEHPGYTRVTRVDAEALAEDRAPVAQYGMLNARVEQVYGVSLDRFGVPWMAPDWRIGQSFQVKARRIAEVERSRYVMWMSGSEDGAQPWSFSVELRDEGIEVTRLADGTTYKDLQSALELMG
jgi:hypothetical protein